MRKKGKLFIISAPSGSGKTTLEKMLLDCDDLNLIKSVSVTTRKMRRDEKEGRDYCFVSKKEFLRKKEAGDFLEWAEVFSNYYATPKEKIEASLKEKKNIFLSIDVQGAGQIKKIYPDAVFIFIEPPSADDLKKRLIGRKTNNEDDIKRRLEVAGEELSQKKMYNYIVINDTIERAFRELKDIIKKEIKEH